MSGYLVNTVGLYPSEDDLTRFRLNLELEQSAAGRERMAIVDWLLHAIGESSVQLDGEMVNSSSGNHEIELDGVDRHTAIVAMALLLAAPRDICVEELDFLLGDVTVLEEAGTLAQSFNHPGLTQ